MDLDLANLTAAEREALSLVADGRTSKEIARTLGISASAVNQRIDSARRKLGDVSRAEAARRLRACDEITGYPIGLADDLWPAPTVHRQQDELQVEEPHYAFEHEADAASKLVEPRHDLTPNLQSLKAALQVALLILGLLLTGWTVMQTANDHGPPLLKYIR